MKNAPVKKIDQSMEKWKTFSDVDLWVQEAASLFATVPGASAEYVAAYMGKPVATVKQAFSHPVVRERIKSLEFMILQKQSELTDDITQIRGDSVKRLKEVAPTASARDAIAIARFACEVHPDRAFVKMERTEHRHDHTHRATGDLLESLKQRHLSASQPIQIEAQVIEDDEEPIEVQSTQELAEAMS